MQKKLMLITLLFSALCYGAEVTPKEIIEKSDKVRNVSNSYYQRCLITEYINAKKRDTMLVSIYSKLEENSGQYRTLVRMIEPKSDHNKLIMRDGNNLWFYDPNSKASIQISAQQRLLGQSSNGDVMSSNFALDYNVLSIKEEKTRGGDKQEHDCYLIVLQAHNADVSYPFVEYWVEKKSFYPIRGKFYTQSKRLLKEVYYRKFKEVLGVVRPTEVLILDGFDPNKATKMEFGQFENLEIPNFWFTRAFLPQFTGK